MKKSIYVVGVVLLLTGAVLSGCAQQKTAASSADAIEQSKAMATVDQQANYLVQQAQALLSKENYEEAIKTANYIIANFKDKSADAQKVIADAQAKLQKVAQEKLNQVQGEANKAMDGLNKKLGTMGK